MTQPHIFNLPSLDDIIYGRTLLSVTYNFLAIIQSYFYLIQKLERKLFLHFFEIRKK